MCFDSPIQNIIHFQPRSDDRFRFFSRKNGAKLKKRLGSSASFSPVIYKDFKNSRFHVLVMGNGWPNSVINFVAELGPSVKHRELITAISFLFFPFISETTLTWAKEISESSRRGRTAPCSICWVQRCPLRKAPLVSKSNFRRLLYPEMFILLKTPRNSKIIFSGLKVDTTTEYSDFQTFVFLENPNQIKLLQIQTVLDRNSHLQQVNVILEKSDLNFASSFPPLNCACFHWSRPQVNFFPPAAAAAAHFAHCPYH